MRITATSVGRLAIAAVLLTTQTVQPQAADERPYFRMNSGKGTPVPEIGKDDKDTNAVQVSASPLTFRQDKQASASPAKAFGGTGTYTWTLSQGPLPDGMSLGSDGTVNGTPTTARTYPVRMLATDGEGRSKETPAFDMTVIGKPFIGYDSAKLPPGQTVALYPKALRNLIGGGRYAIVEGSLPGALRVDPSSGNITGATGATAVVARGLKVSVTDSDGEIGISDPFDVEITGTAADVFGQTATTRVGVPYALTFQSQGLAKPITYSRVGAAWPDGLDLDQSNDRLSGTPARAGTFSDLAVHAKDSNGVEATSPKFTLTVVTAGVSKPGTLAAPLNKDFSYRIASSNLESGATWMWTGTTPPGLRLDGDTIKGVPTVAGTYPGINVKAVDSGGDFSTGEFTIKVTSESLGITAASAKVRQGDSATLTPKLQPATPGATWSVTGAPAGMTQDATTGALSGVPAATASSVVIKATANGLSGQSDPLSVTVYPPLDAKGTPLGTMVGQPTDLALTATGVIGTASWKLVSGTLPDGLILRSDGHVVGTPTAQGNATNLVARVTDSGDNATDDTPAFSVAVAASDRMLVTGLSGVYGTRVNRALALPAPTVTNAQGNPTFEATTNLPAGLSVNRTTGVISGTATMPGNGDPIQVIASDARPSTANSPAFAIRLVPALALEGVGNMTVKVGQYLTSGVSAKNLMGQGQFALLPEGVALPAGIRFETFTGRILGRPIQSTVLSGLSIKVTDPVDGETVTSAPFDLDVTPGLVLDGPSLLTAQVGQAFNSGTSFVVRNAAGQLSWRIVAGSLPAGLSLDVLTGRISGTPTEQVKNTGIVLHAEQSDGLYGESQPFSIDAAGAMNIMVGTNQAFRINTASAITPVASNNIGAVTWSVDEGAPPLGMNFDAKTGKIYGVTPKAGVYGPIRLRAVDSAGQRAVSDRITVRVGEALRIARTGDIPNQRFGATLKPYNPFTVTGAMGSYTVKPNNMPPGMLMASDGTISGKHGTEGCCWFLNAVVTDSTGAVANTDFTISGWMAQPWHSGKDYPWYHTASSTTKVIARNPFTFYEGGGPAIEGLIDRNQKHFELVDPSQVPAWMTFNPLTSELYGTAPDSGTYGVDVRLVDDVDGARSNVHRQIIQVASSETRTQAGVEHIRARLDRSFDRKLIDTANGKFASRPAGWCRSNVPGNNKPGLWINLREDCSIYNYPWDVNGIGNYDGYWIEATDDDGVVHRVDFDVQVAPKLSASSPNPVCTRDPNASFSIKAQSTSGLMGNPTYSLVRWYYWEPRQPLDGMAFDTSTGTLSGLPKNYRYESDEYMVKIVDDWDGSAVAVNLPFEYRTPFNPTFPDVLQRNYKDFENAFGVRTNQNFWNPITWTQTGDVPPGITLFTNGTDAWFRGTYTKAGVYSGSIRAVGDCPAGVTKDIPFRFEVSQYITPTPPDSVTMREGVPSTTAPAPQVEYGSQPLSWSLPCCWSLPQGVSVDPGTGQFTGTPALGTAGVRQTQLYVRDDKGGRYTPEFTLVVLPAPGLTYDEAIPARVNTNLSAAPQTTNVAGPATFVLSQGTIPSDLGIGVDAATGNIVGTPTRQATVSGLRVSLTDSSGLTAPSNVFSVQVSTGPTASIGASQTGTVGAAFKATPTATGTLGSVSWSLAGGELPPGVTVDSASGEVKGSPLAKGTYPGVTLAVTDSTGARAVTNAFSVAVAQGTLPDPTLNMFCNNAQNGSILMAPSGSGSGGSGGSSMPNNGSPSGSQTGPSIPSCRVNLWEMSYTQNGTYQDWIGSALLYDTEGQRSITLAAEYDWVKLVDVDTGKSYVTSSNVTWVMSNYVPGPGDRSRTFYALAKRAGIDEYRVSGQFVMFGSYGSAKTATGDPNDPANVPHWFWDRQQCITTCNEYGICDARQYQVCRGAACTETSRTCYQVYQRGTATSQPVGQETTSCYYPQYGGMQEYCP